MNNTSLLPRIKTPQSGTTKTPPSDWIKNQVTKHLYSLEQAGLHIIYSGSRLRSEFFGDAAANLQAHIHIRNEQFWKFVAFDGANGAAEAYIMGYWDSPDLSKVIRIFARNRDVIKQVDSGFAKLRSLPKTVLGYFLHNSRGQARKYISAHYDLGNDFFQSFLDSTMNYSSAYFRNPQQSLEEASYEKMDLLCQKLQLNEDDELLEIGTGWGGLAIHAAQNYGCKVVTTTISQKQYDLAAQRIKNAGLEDRITLLLKDYRDLEGNFNKLVSVEMIEAIGWRQYKTFFSNCSRLLREDGLAVIQAITIPDQEFHRAKSEQDFIKRYIFPGSCIPSVAALQQAMAEASDCNTIDLEDFTPHYARTLRIWDENCQAQKEHITKLGYDEYFQRLWHYYLAYCEGGFAERAIGVVHLSFAKPAWRMNEERLQMGSSFFEAVQNTHQQKALSSC